MKGNKKIKREVDVNFQRTKITEVVAIVGGALCFWLVLYLDYLFFIKGNP